MSGRGPRWINAIQWPKYIAAISGTLSTSYGYATINDTKYKDEASVEIERNTEITVFVSSSRSSLRENCQVTMNGTVVQSGHGSYTFTAASNVSIVFERVESGRYNYFTCDITTG